jgi:hypothetical protein
MEMETQTDLDALLADYKAAVEEWIAAIRAEEEFATPDHSMKEWELWDQAGLREEEVAGKATTARLAYVDALRAKLYNF